MTDTNIIPEIGVFRDVPAAVYHRWEAASASRLNVIRQRSPKHMRWEADHPSPSTPALVLGEAVHTLILQPQLWPDRYVIPGPCEAVLKSGDRKGDRCGSSARGQVNGEWLCGKHGGESGGDSRIVLSSYDVGTVEGMRNAVLSDPWARSLLDSRTDTELSIVWRDEETGVLCKARMDAACFASSLVWDLKTTQDASPAGFAKSLANFGYDLQAAHYLEAVQQSRETDYGVSDFCFVCVEKEPPHATAVYRVTDRNLSAVRERRLGLLRAYGECVESGNWPGYSDTIQDIEVPAWEMKKLEASLSEA